MRQMRSLFIISLVSLIAVACSEREEPLPVTGPTLDAMSAGPGLAVYGIGQTQRAITQPCRAPEHRQFDFWVGLWNIENPAGDHVGTSVITSELDGCLIMEDFIGALGGHGRSINVYDADLDEWYQTYVDGNIGNFRISGGLIGDEMVMTGSQLIFRFPSSIVQRDTRISWTPNPDGTVRQFIQNSFDGGPVEPGFDGLYVPADQLDRADTNPFSVCRLASLPQHRQLDFWLGEWTVTAANGPELGTSAVTLDLDDCLIEENFQTPRGYRNRSFAFYDFVIDTWFRTFADVNGEHVQLSGGLVDGKMVLTGTDIAPDGRPFELRVTLAEAGAGTVRQTWEVSHDGGETWRTDLDLEYASR